MTKRRHLTAGAVAAIAAGALLTGVAFAASDPSDADDIAGAAGSAIANLAQTTTLTGEAKGDAISAAAQAMTTRDVDDTKAADEDETNESASSDRDDHSTSTDRDAHGDAVSELATTTTLTGEAKGDAISAAAKAGRPRH